VGVEGFVGAVWYLSMEKSIKMNKVAQPIIK
jgi:hypothetical protein